MSGRAFFDTNVLLHLLSEDSAKADRAEELLAKGDILSVQVLNEFAHVARRKLRMSWVEVAEVLDTVRAVCTVEPLTGQECKKSLEVRLLARRSGDRGSAALRASTGSTTIRRMKRDSSSSLISTESTELADPPVLHGTIVPTRVNHISLGLRRRRT
jgi:predicted nucleic acid-binding protein